MAEADVEERLARLEAYREGDVKILSEVRGEIRALKKGVEELVRARSEGAGMRKLVTIVLAIVTTLGSARELRSWLIPPPAQASAVTVSR